VPAGGHRLSTPTMTNQPCASVFCGIAAGGAGVGYAKSISISFEPVGMELLGIVAQGEGEDGWGIGGGNVGILLAQVVQSVGIVDGLEPHLKTVVAMGCREWSMTWWRERDSWRHS